MGSCWSLCVLIGRNASLWILMGVYGFFIRPYGF